MPQRNIDWKYSIEALSELLDVEISRDAIKPHISKNDSNGFSPECAACHKSRPGIVAKNCDLCRDMDFKEEMLCGLNRSVQEGEAFECKVFRPILKLAGGKNVSSAEPVPETEEESLLQSEAFKYKKAHAIQRLKRNPDEEIVCLKYHLVWNTIQRKSFFKDIGKDADKINLLFEDVGAESDVVADIMFLAADHIHMYLESDGEKSVDSLVKEIKANSRRRLLSEFAKLFDKSDDIWDEAYFVETIA
jgi:REP element-mobilizing transposase RayT